MAKHPLDLGDKKFSKEELAEALRLSIIAELDAINLYLQLARSIDDEAVRKVFEDVADEEKTHVGEFLALLKNIDPKQVEELRHGAEEVEELTGLKTSDPPETRAEAVGQNSDEDEWNFLREAFVKAAEAYRRLRKHLPLYKPGRGVEAVVVERISVEEGVIKPRDRSLVPLQEVSVKFMVSQQSLDHARRRGEKPDIPSALFAASRLAQLEDELLLKGLLECGEAEKTSMSSWEKGGAAVDEVSKAVGVLVSKGIPGPYVLLVSPDRYARLVAVHERTGVMELTRLKQIVGEVVAVPQLPGDKALLLSANPAMMDVAIGADTVVDYIGPEDSMHLFRAWETLALRIKNPEAIIVMLQEGGQSP